MGYPGRWPNTPTTIEWFGTGVVVVPMHARLAEYVRSAELPLWNPYQGLGQPFAAQGDGNPYFPVAIVRALLPYAASDYVTLAMYYVAAVFLYLFLRGLDLSEVAAVFGASAFVLSGALSLHIARPNIGDQLCMLPVLFWAAAKAMRERKVVWFTVFALASALHLIGGFIQIAMIGAVLLAAFCLVYESCLTSSRRSWGADALFDLGVFALGNGLVAFYLLPMAEIIRISFNARGSTLAFLLTPYANLISFFFPTVFGPFFQNWVPGAYPDVTDWNNLYAHASIGILLLVVFGWSVRSSMKQTQQRRLFAFFSLAGGFLLLRYVLFPPAAAVNLLPVLGRQTPKHSTGAAVFCFVIAAAITVEVLKARPNVRWRWWAAALFGAVVSSVLTEVGQRGGFRTINGPLAKLYVASTVLISVGLLLAIWLARRWGRLSPANAGVLVTGAVLAELSLYLPLGNNTDGFLEARLGIFGLIIAAGLLLSTGWKVSFGAVLAGALAVYTALIVRPGSGLPRQFNVDTPPKFMTWLSSAAGDSYRNFGIAPDFSSIAPIPDVDVVGPFSPRSFANFVDLVGSQAVSDHFREVGVFLLTIGIDVKEHYDLKDYPRVKPIFDWLGIRYVVLDRQFFRTGARTDDVAIRSGDAQLKQVYEDGSVTVLESRAAQSRAAFSPNIAIYPNEAAILGQLHADPSSIFGPPMVEAGAISGTDMSAAHGGPEQAAQIEVSRPNYVRVSGETPEPGLLVLKDSYYPGWQASVNGTPAKIVQVDGMVRGVWVPTIGHYEVEFSYRPTPFVVGAVFAGLTCLLFVGNFAYCSLRRKRSAPLFTAAGCVLVVVLMYLSAQAYFGVVPGERFVLFALSKAGLGVV